MRTRPARTAAILALACLAACSSGSNPKPAGSMSSVTRIIPAQAGLVAGTGPTGDGRTWVLAGSKAVKTLAQIVLRSGKQVALRPVAKEATSVAASVSGVIGVGLATGNSGAIQFRNGTTGGLLSTTSVAAPVIDVAAGDDATTFYLLTVRRGVATIAVVNSQSGKVEATVPVAAAAVAVVPTPDQQAVYVLSSSGVIDQVSASTSGRREAEFSVPISGIDLALSPSGKTLFVLGGPAATPSISIVDLATEAQVSVAPAAAHSVAVAAGLDDNHVYDLVGTRKVGNIQLIKLTGA
ncbi:MAG TPA: hypothetical protein VHV76_02830 [Mycobacteriales bacterium]|jgi:hypothetical protein|nr:hypothetical protein [Mycobacteriales bacterium]